MRSLVTTPSTCPFVRLFADKPSTHIATALMAHEICVANNSWSCNPDGDVWFNPDGSIGFLVLDGEQNIVNAHAAITSM